MHFLRKSIRVCCVPCFIFLSIITTAAIGQQARFQLGSGSASPGGTATVNLTLTNANGAAPASLQFTLGYPTTSVAGVTLNAGSSANSAGKVLNCTSGTTGQTACLLYGIDAAVIGNGVLATIGVQLAAKPASTTFPVTLNGVTVSDANGEVISSTDSDGSITVNPAASTALSSLSCTPASVSVAGTVQCTVALSNATSTALTVSLTSNSVLVAVPASVVVASGASSTQFTASVNTFKKTHSIVLTATANSVLKTFNLQLQPANTPPAKVTLSGSLGTGAGAVGDSVTLRSSSGQVLQTVASDGSGAFAFPGVAAGTYVVTPSQTGVVFAPSSRTVSVTTSSVTGINFTNQTSTPVAGKIVVDGRASKDQQSSSATVTVPLTTHAANELLLAFVATDSSGSLNTVVNSVSGGGLTWTLVVRSNKQSGTSEIWRAFAKVPVSNVAVTAALSQQVVSSISVISFSGVQTTGTGGSGAVGAIAQGYGSSGSPSATLKTTKSGSLVVGVGNDYDNAIARSPFAGQQLLHQDLSSTGDTYWAQILNGAVPVAGTRVTFGDSSPSSDQFNLAICEVLPAGGN